MPQLTYYITKLLEYCEKENFSGYDLYDGLNSLIFVKSPLYKSRICRLVFIQLIKRLPINIRPLLLIPKTQNPKALALFLMAFVKLKKAGLLENDNLTDLMIERLIALRSPQHLVATRGLDFSDQRSAISENTGEQGYNLEIFQPVLAEDWNNSKFKIQNSRLSCDSNKPNKLNEHQIPTNPIKQTDQIDYSCWGYSFPWQTRTVLVPRGYPNLVCTVFVANALLDVYEFKKDKRCLDIAKSAAEYILNELYWEEDNIAGFSYPLPSLRNKVHNANFLGAALLTRIYAYTSENKFIEPALKAARYSASRQNQDGSWFYGEHPTQKWIDNFHTGYNLCALKAINEYADTTEFASNIKYGFEFYSRHFFEKDTIPKYFHDRTYPIDIHSVAQSIITLLALDDFGGDRNLAQSVLKWALNNLWNNGGYFYFQVTPYYKNRIAYMRWSQAWMLFALATSLSSL